MTMNTTTIPGTLENGLHYSNEGMETGEGEGEGERIGAPGVERELSTLSFTEGLSRGWGETGHSYRLFSFRLFKTDQF